MSDEKKKHQPGIIRVGISTCLLGEKVRWDAGHKRDRYITDILGEYFEWVPVCPELDVGMGVPREPVRLTGPIETPRMVGVKSGDDWTSRMTTYAEKRVASLTSFNLSGYILKSDSPSCGMERVKVYAASGMPSKKGRGLFATRLIREHPLLPVEEEGRLNDPALRENFITRVFRYHRLRSLFEKKFTIGDLVEFHTSHKYLMLAHSPTHYSRLGRIVASAKGVPRGSLADSYSALFMEGLAIRATTKKHVNVLQHILGFLRAVLTSDERTEILSTIEDYHKELVPLIVPVTLIRHHVRKHNIGYIANQVYLNPHPKELMLRNHV